MPSLRVWGLQGLLFFSIYNLTLPSGTFQGWGVDLGFQAGDSFSED